MMDAMKVAAVLRRAAENAGCGLHEVVSGGGDCPKGSCNGCREASAAWANEAADAIERCAMPDGVEWPRFEDGGLVKFGDFIGVPDGAWMEHPVDQVLFTEDGNVEVFGDGNSVAFERGETAKRIVLAADGEPLEVGQTVWNINNGMEFSVSRLPKPGEYQAVEVRYRNGSSTSFDPCQLTHQRPVLDADGAPIKVGDEVWNTNGGGPYTVTDLDPEHMHVGVTCNTHDGKLDWGFEAAFLTHAKPEPPDKTCEDCAYFAKDPNAVTMGVCFAKTVRYGSNKFAYKFTCRWNQTCEKYEERGER